MKRKGGFPNGKPNFCYLPTPMAKALPLQDVG